MKHLPILLLLLLANFLPILNITAQNHKRIEVDEKQQSLVIGYDSKICFFTSATNPISSIEEVKIENIAISSFDLLSFIPTFCKDFNLAKFTPGAYTAVSVSLSPPDQVFGDNNQKFKLYIAYRNQMDSVKNAVKIEFVSKPMEKTQNELLTKNVICNDSYLTVKDKGFVKGIAIASGSERKIYSTSANFSLCYVNVFVDIKGENTFKLDLDKVKLVDNLDVEYPVFGISASSFNEIKIDTRTEYSGGKTANIDFEVAYNSNISHINLHHIIGKYNLNGTTVTNNGSVIINLIERGTLSIFAGEKKNFIHLSKTPNDFTLAFIVPESSNLFELKINNQAYSIPLPINTNGRNILAYDERTNQAKGGSQLVITSNGVKP
jgi:hypothetical protein